MKSPKLQKFISLTFLSVLLVGCGKGGDNLNGTSFSTALTLQPVRNLTPDERNIATRICYAYKSKESTFQTAEYMGGTFSFNITSKDCAKKSESYIVKSILATDTNGYLTLQSETTKSFRPIVQTTTVGYLAQVCPKIQNNLAVSNTVTISIDERVQVVFSKDSMDTFSIQRFVPNSKNEYVIKSSETFKIRTQATLTANGQILGMDEIFIKQVTCTGDTNTYSEFIQTFTSFNK